MILPESSAIISRRFGAPPESDRVVADIHAEFVYNSLMADSNKHNTRRIGKGMTFVAWIIALSLFTFFFENTGNPSSPDFSSPGVQTEINGTGGSFIDIGGDGDLDLLQTMAQGWKAILLFKRT